MDQSWSEYYADVRQDIEGLKTVYPFVQVFLPPTTQPQLVQLTVVAVDNDVVHETFATKDDFLGEYSKRVFVTIPRDYKLKGCNIYGGKWINTKVIPSRFHHFNGQRQDGERLLCVGVPDSFKEMRNVLLENIKTADRMLTAYELFQTGKTNRLELIAYSHGEKGINEYRKQKKKYQTK